MDNNIWTTVLSKIKNDVNSLLYDTWFSETTLYKVDNNVISIIVPFAVHKNHLQTKYYNDLL